MLPLILDATQPTTATQPIRVGLPVARGALSQPNALELRDDSGSQIACQGEALARWPDGSVRWLLLDCLAAGVSERQEWKLHLDTHDAPLPHAMTAARSADAISVSTGVIHVRLDTRTLALTATRMSDNASIVAPNGGQWRLTDVHGKIGTPVVERCVVEVEGIVRTTVRLEGRFGGTVPARFVARYSFFADTALVRVDLTIHNPRRARHPGGLWDLGDAGSMLFRDLSLEVPLAGSQPVSVQYRAEPGDMLEATGDVEIYQGSSGGENWRSENHLDRNGRVPLTMRGYRVRAGKNETTGLRATPTLSVRSGDNAVSAAVADFWQQFPKALEASEYALFIRLFPGQFGEPFELQGGEQKTHTVWLDLAGGELDWVAAPVHAHTTSEPYCEAGLLGHVLPGPGHDLFARQVSGVVEGPHSFVSGRERIDEYGWRNFGEVFADHEQENYTGSRPFVSHYNNQYDIVAGLLRQYFRTADARWLNLAVPLAQHVADIDIYHTQEDKTSYNGGLFWFTDHYFTAVTCTHRSYTRHNRPAKGDYGGGPSSNHLFTTGLLSAFYLTGNPLFRDAVLELAAWVIAMDDGKRTVLGLIDDGPTGYATATGTLDYHGPGRGCGNSVNALLDAWLLTGKVHYLTFAETLIRRSIHPDDDLVARQLLDVEKRWSYTVFLSVLARYLELKAEAGQRDAMYAYARESLLRYATWMLEHERPYYDKPEQLEFPTEAWAGQELRKANVLRLAAEHAAEPLRSRMLSRGEELADRAWQDLYRFTSRNTSRAQALVMAEGPRDDFFRRSVAKEMPPSTATGDFGPPVAFVPQKQRVMQMLRSPIGLLRALGHAMNPRRWMRPKSVAKA